MDEEHQPMRKRRRTAAFGEQPSASPPAGLSKSSTSLTVSSSFTSHYTALSRSTDLSTTSSLTTNSTTVSTSSSFQVEQIAESPLSNPELPAVDSPARVTASELEKITARDESDQDGERPEQRTKILSACLDTVSKPAVQIHSPIIPEKTGLYASLPLLSSWSIRLLRLLPASSGPQLTGELFVAKLDNPVDFAALSYTWGEPYEGFEGIAETVDISGHPLEIRANLAGALRQLRYKDKPRTLWIDAICIDQLHERERGYQIEIMEHIYSRARCVLVWLGEDSPMNDGACVYDFCRIIEQYGLRPSYNAKKAINAYGARWPNHKALGRQFAQRKYWRRRWIIQELCHAHDVKVLCGTGVASLSTFSACVHKIPSSRRAMQDVKELCTTVTHLRQALQDWRDGYGRSSQVSTLSDFIWMLQRFHDFDCLDPRDRLFALVSLWKGDIPTSTIMGDYFVPCEELYIRFASNMINMHSPPSQILRQLLSIAADQACHKDLSDSDPSLPTWLVDWRLDPAKRIGPNDVFGDVCITEPVRAQSTKLSLGTRCYGQIVEAEGHYRDWILMSSDGLLMPSFVGSMPDEDYIAALGSLCPKVQVGDLLCQPYSTYRARHGHVADAAVVLRPVAESVGTFRIVGRCPLDLWWHEAQGESRRTENLPTDNLNVVVE